MDALIQLIAVEVATTTRVILTAIALELVGSCACQILRDVKSTQDRPWPPRAAKCNIEEFEW